MSEPSDAGDLTPEPTEWQLEAARQPERRIIFTAPRQHGKSAGLTSLLRFHAESVGNWLYRDDSRLVSDPPNVSEDDQ